MQTLSPQEILDLFAKYVDKMRDNPILVEDYVGKDAIRVWRKKQRPLMLNGFFLFCYTNGVKNMKKMIATKGEEYQLISDFIMYTIEEDQIGGGLIGIYNPAIVSKLNNLVEKSELKQEYIQVRMNLDQTKKALNGADLREEG